MCDCDDIAAVAFLAAYLFRDKVVCFGIIVTDFFGICLYKKSSLEGTDAVVLVVVVVVVVVAIGVR